MEKLLKEIVSRRKTKQKKLSESIANLENQIIDKKLQGNTRAVKALEMVLNRIKKEKVKMVGK